MFSRRESWAMFVVLIVAFGAANSAARADAPLRWKFKVGDKLAYDTEQDVTIKVKGVPGGDAEMRTEQQLNLSWEVLEVNDEGEAKIRQKLDRVRLKMTSPAAGGDPNVKKTETVEYDSQAKDPPVGGAASAAAIFEPIMKEPFEITITPRGEVKDAKVPEAVLGLFKNNPGAAQMGIWTTADGMQRALMQDVIELPEAAIASGETWNRKIEMPIPVVGKQSMETTYTYGGEKDVDGKQLAAIGMKRRLQYGNGNAQQAQVKIKDQSSDGEALFSVAEGRLKSATQDQKITIEDVRTGAPITHEIHQKSKITVRRADEAATSASP
jgi:hypothetical protein